ncbi:MAG: Ni/Fe-hydrogenase cytochrome b subunit [Bryobacterales bacterium]|nr:Ni/Fe-hydrogenase cytochrome b subunit [Bryobacterales bacterium]
MPFTVPKLTVWRSIFVLLMLAGLYAVFVRVTSGLAGATNLSDQFPWGLWIGFDILCGVGLAAGGFTLVAVVEIFNIKRYRPILRPAVLTAFLGYVLVILALLLDLGRPFSIWHAIIMWNPHSVMFEVAWCVMLYTTVLFLEFLPAVFERLGWKAPLGWLHAISVPLVILGVILSTLHQSSLGSLFLIVPYKMHPLWYTPWLPVFFFVSAVCVGMAMTIFESWHSTRAFGRRLEFSLLESMGRVLAVLLSVYVTMRFLDLAQRGALSRVLENRTESYLFGLEALLMIVPMLMLYSDRIRSSPGKLYASALMVVFGFVTNRLNVSVTALEAGSGTQYIPKWTEVAVTLAIVAGGFAVFRIVAAYLPVFEAAEEEPAAARTAPEPVAAGGD